MQPTKRYCKGAGEYLLRTVSTWRRRRWDPPGKLFCSGLNGFVLGGSVFFSADSASAAHCVDGDTRGFSYFGNDHNQETAHTDEGVNNGKHSPGASNCGDTPGSAAAIVGRYAKGSKRGELCEIDVPPRDAK